MEINLDAVDRQILREMQENARISNVEMAKKLEMAPSAMLERVKKLELKKVITRYTTCIDPVALDQKLLAFIFIKAADGWGADETGEALARMPEVQEVHHIAGEDCYLIKVRTTDSASLMKLMRKGFSNLPNIISTKTIIVLETVKEEQKLVIPQ